MKSKTYEYRLIQYGNEMYSYHSKSIEGALGGDDWMSTDQKFVTKDEAIEAICARINKDNEKFFIVIPWEEV